MKRALLTAALAALLGCSSSDRGLDQGGGQPAPPVDHPLGNGLSANPRRLSADQWGASMGVIFGTGVDGKPIAWKAGTRPALDQATIAQSFGEPDYITTTEEDLSPSVLYAKYTDDAARDLCGQAQAADAVRTDAKTRVLTRFVAPTDTVATNQGAIDHNLRYLKLRFHGVKIEPTDTASLDGLRKLFTTAATASTAPDLAKKNDEAWLAVCVALVTAPEFHIY